jgi:hypothetical protein
MDSIRYQDLNQKKHLKYQSPNMLYITNMLGDFISAVIDSHLISYVKKQIG